MALSELLLHFLQQVHCIAVLSFILKLGHDIVKFNSDPVPLLLQTFNLLFFLDNFTNLLGYLRLLPLILGEDIEIFKFHLLVVIAQVSRALLSFFVFT